MRTAFPISEAELSFLTDMKALKDAPDNGEGTDGNPGKSLGQ